MNIIGCNVAATQGSGLLINSMSQIHVSQHGFSNMAADCLVAVLPVNKTVLKIIVN